MRARSLAHGLVIGALAAFVLLLFAGIAAAQAGPGAGAVQGQNGAAGAAAVTGPAGGVNNAVIGAGPTAGGIGGTSQSQQLGDNSVTVNQSSTAKSGDAVAGSQVTGVVGGGNTTIQNQNSSRGSVAVSGPAVASNNAAVSAGPRAGTLGGQAQAGQVGDNSVNVNQRSEAASGDAVAGSQVTGVVGGGATVQNSNSSRGNLAVSGPACASFVCGGGNNLFVGAGPTAASAGILGASASAGQVGDNDVVISQSSTAKSGDALAGAQVTGIVGWGDNTVQNQNSSRFNFGFSGPAVATNVAGVNAGPTAATAGLLLSNAQVSQAGSNRVVVAQESGAVSGDALAGSQVTGLVSSEIGSITVQNQQSSDFDFARSGGAFAVNVAPVAAGPTALSLFGGARTSQIGDNVVLASQSTLAESGDALAGSGVVGVVGGSDVTVQTQNRAFLPVALSGPVVAGNVAPVAAGPVSLDVLGPLGGASATQFGNNVAALDQDVHASSGDALAGSQSTGVVSDGADVTVQNSNSAILPVALTGPVVAGNVAPLQVGPVAASVSLLGATANVSQVGNNRAAVSQGVHAASGDAVAGSQVTGVVGGAGGRAVVSNQNASLGSLALSGPVVTGNLLFANVGPTATALSLLPTTANASQLGNNDLLFSQDVDAESGDGIAGSQIVGVIAGLDPAVQQQNATLGSLGVSGIVTGGNQAGGSLGASAAAPGLLGTANTQQAGDSRLAGSQALDMASGDGVSGGQIVGALTGAQATSTPGSFGGGFTADTEGAGVFTASTGAGVGI